MRGLDGVFRRGAVLWASLLMGVVVVGGFARTATSQTGVGRSGMGGVGMQSTHEPGDPSKQDSAVTRMQEQQAKSRNDDRQKRLSDDTAKLYALAGELKDEVAKTDKNKLSVDVIKKADEIEHLAHSVKERMKG